MATSENKLKEMSAIVIADATDYAGAGGTRTDQIDLTGLGANSYRQSVKVDFLALRGHVIVPCLCVEYDSAVTGGEYCHLWVGFSNSGTAGTANPGGLSGSDSSYSGTTGDSAADSIKQCTYLGALIATSDGNTVPQRQWLQPFVPLERYGCFVVHNAHGSITLNATDAIEMYIRLVPLITEDQNV